MTTKRSDALDSADRRLLGSEPASPDPVAEQGRLAALARYGVLDTAPEEAFDDIIELAAHLCGTPTALVSLVDEGRQWFKARLGMDVCSTERDVAFCAHALSRSSALVVPDATADPRFATNPLVTGPPGIRFYAGAPLRTHDGFVLGTLCVIDTEPRTLTGQQIAMLEKLAAQVMTQLEHRRHAHALAVEVAAREGEQAAHAATRRVLDGVLEHTDVLVHATDHEGRFLLANGALHRLLGRPDGSVLGRRDDEVFPADIARRRSEQDRSVLESGRASVTSELLHRADGSARTYRSTRFPLRDPDGRVYAVARVCSDVTDLERTTADLAASEERWRALVAHSPVAVAVYGADDLLFRYANDRAAHLYGAARPEELVGTSFLDLFQGTDRAAYLQRLARILGGETVLNEPAHIVGRDGLARDVEVNASLINWAGLPAVQVEMRDVTARVAAAQALQSSEARFRALFASAPVGSFEILPDGTFVAVNPQLCRSLGYEPHELIGRTVALVTEPAERDEQRRALTDFIRPQGPSTFSTERTFRRKDGATVPVLISVGAVRDPDGRVQRIIGSIVDLSQRVAIENQLREALDALAERQLFTDALMDNVEVGIVACDAAGHLTVFNGAARTWHGVDADHDLDPEQHARGYALFESDGVTPLTTDQIPLHAALEHGRVRDQEIVIAPTGRPPVRVMSSAQALLDANGAVVGAVAAMHDITALRASEESQRESATFHDAVLVASPDLIFVTDIASSTIVWSSRSLMDTLGYDEQQVRDLGPELQALTVHPDDLARLRSVNAAARDLADAEVLQTRYRVKNSNGEYRWLSRRITPFHRGPDGAVRHVLAIARDITDVVDVEERLTEAALHDALTGLRNRRLLSDRLSLALSRTSRAQTEVAILFCDLDGFKHINDTAGHAAGDTVLVATAERLRQVLRPQDTVARVGGDEFVVVLEPVRRERTRSADGSAATPPPTDLNADALLVAGRIKQALAVPVQVDGVDHVVTVSIGVTFARAGDDPEEALRDADTAMYQAKSRGKDRHEVFQTSLRADAVERGRVEQVLRAALRDLPVVEGAAADGNGDRPVLSLAYQPIVELASQRLVGVEALARLSDVHGQAIPPDVFIPIAEETGLIAALGRYVLDQACTDLADWHARFPAHRRLGMAVNLSARQAGLADLTSQVTQSLERTGLAPAALTLELTESVLLEAGRSTTKALRELHRLGVKISIDDFGTGYASLRYLTELPVTGVKVDRTFTSGLPEDQASSTIIRAVTTLAAELQLSCVVEGIETDAQLLALPPGVLGQGYLLGRPQSAADLQATLQRRQPPNRTPGTTRVR